MADTSQEKQLVLGLALGGTGKGERNNHGQSHETVDAAGRLALVENAVVLRVGLGDRARYVPAQAGIEGDAQLSVKYQLLHLFDRAWHPQARFRCAMKALSVRHERQRESFV